jgi:hypothetical protein
VRREGELAKVEKSMVKTEKDDAARALVPILARLSFILPAQKARLLLLAGTLPAREVHSSSHFLAVDT